MLSQSRSLQLQRAPFSILLTSPHLTSPTPHPLINLFSLLHLFINSHHHHLFISLNGIGMELVCDELLQEIIQRLPPSSTSSISLVSKRWLHLHRSSKTSLTIRLPPNYNNNNNNPSLSTFLSHYPHISSLTLTLTSSTNNQNPFSISPDNLLLSIASTCSNLRHLRFYAGPVTSSALLSSSSKLLTSLTISSSKPLSFTWLSSFPSLNYLSFTKSNDNPPFDFNQNYHQLPTSSSQSSHQLPLDTLCLSGIGAGDTEIGWLWNNCNNLRKLRFKSCQGTGGDSSSFDAFLNCCKGIQELELRSCRAIVDGVLLQLAEHNNCLQSLLLYDGGSQEGLHRFLSRSKPSLRNLDLRLPLDLNDQHLSTLAQNFSALVTLRLESCCLVTGEGLKELSLAMRDGLEELGLISCDAVEREPGLLVTLGQNLRRLKKLDLSYNQMLLDKEIVSMLASCNNLIELNLKGCTRLTTPTLFAILKSCKALQYLDITQCFGIGVEAVQLFIANSIRLRRIHVEQSKLSDVANTWVSQKFIQVVD